MDELIQISQLNDFIFCPASIYFHNLYGITDTILYQSDYQINGTAAHKNIDEGTYSCRKDILCGIDVFCEKYGLKGKIDIFDIKSGILTERKRFISALYDGQIFQLYGQFFALIEMGYEVKKLVIHSIKDNKNYNVFTPYEDKIMFNKFENLIKNIKTFDICSFEQTNYKKCSMCIYEPSCDRSIKC